MQLILFKIFQDLSSNVSAFNKKESKVLPKIGLGGSYNVTNNFALNVSFEHIFSDDLAEFTSKANNYQLSIIRLYSC